MIANRFFVFCMSILIVGFSPIGMLNFTATVFAEEIVVSGNGAESSSSVNVVSQTTSNVEQKNEANVSNNVETNANTGDNTASDNNGDVAIKTGDVTSNVDINNQANTSVVDNSSCCSNEQSNIVVSGNGADTSNSVNASSTTIFTTKVSQNAEITNSVNGSAVTGNNNASFNSGDVVIKTGGIKINENIVNNSINNAIVSVVSGEKKYEILVKGNGTGSVNNVSVSNVNVVENIVINNANIFNNSLWNLISGNNTANGNSGDVYIETGDIESNIVIENKGINDSYVKVDCCKEEDPGKPNPTPTPNEDKPNPTSSSSNTTTSSSGSSNGSSSTISDIGRILPATGAYSLFFILLANVVMLFMGTVLRLRSGRSPGALAVRFV